MNELDALRREIDAVDKNLTALFLKRMELVGQVGVYKQSNGIPVLDAAREGEVLAKKAALADDPAEKADITALFEAIMAISRRRQRRLVREAGNEDFGRIAAAVSAARVPPARPRILYQGEPGAYAEEGVVRFFGESCARSRVDTWEEIFLALREGYADYGVLPIENNSTGAINQVYDLLASYGAYIVGEQTVKVEHCLMAPKGARVEDIRAVYSHEQGLLQCADYLKAHPAWALSPRLNTAESAKYVAGQNDKAAAAIGSRRAAMLYGLDILAECINSNAENYTRFVVVSPVMELRPDRNKISALFVLPHRSGALYAILSIFAVNGLNLLKLESRPISGRSWEYQFFADFAGDLHDPAMDGILRELSQTAEHFRVLGNYRAGD
ncbi:MAG: bifunctional chorismate mutase/prephenate dehydratase [Clostridia bacterium]|nr:bifunctional chorismate mutase/prephenate dehydratase [Clostridia bacterium]